MPQFDVTDIQISSTKYVKLNYQVNLCVGTQRVIDTVVSERGGF